MQLENHFASNLKVAGRNLAAVLWGWPSLAGRRGATPPYAATRTVINNTQRPINSAARHPSVVDTSPARRCVVLGLCVPVWSQNSTLNLDQWHDKWAMTVDDLLHILL